jgi:hypothetical protein
MAAKAKSSRCIVALFSRRKSCKVLVTFKTYPVSLVRQKQIDWDYSSESRHLCNQPELLIAFQPDSDIIEIEKTTLVMPGSNRLIPTKARE